MVARPRLNNSPDIFDVLRALKSEVRSLYVNSIGTARTTIDAGTVQFNVAANTLANINVTFNKPFENVPQISVTPDSTAPQSTFVSKASVTTTGFILFFYRNTATITNVDWLAVDTNY